VESTCATVDHHFIYGVLDTVGRDSWPTLHAIRIQHQTHALMHEGSKRPVQSGWLFAPDATALRTCQPVTTLKPPVDHSEYEGRWLG
jgi:hypothetical protein